MTTYPVQIDALHTTPMGVTRLQRNLSLPTNTDVVAWCQKAVATATPEQIVRRGKNFYIHGKDYIITINAFSHTIITAHKK